MMITQAEVRQTLAAAREQASDKKIEQFHGRILAHFEVRQQELANAFRDQWIAQKKQPVVDGLTWGQMNEAANQQAWDEMRQTYLAEFTQIAGELDLEEDVATNPEALAVTDPNYWKIDPFARTIPLSIYDQVISLWPDADKLWLHYAAALMNYRNFNDLPIPTPEENQEVKDEFAVQIDAAVAEAKNTTK